MGAGEYLDCCRTISLELLDLLGRGYVIDHCMAEIEARARQRRYRAYVTDALMALTENTARAAGGRRLTRRWADDAAPPDDRPGESIARDVMRRAGLTFARSTQVNPVGAP